jgi:hypothetical protein
MSTSAADRRRQAMLDAFRAEIETLDSEELKQRLDAKRIRSEERRAIAEDVLRRREADAIAPLQSRPEPPVPAAGALVGLPSKPKAALQPPASQRGSWPGRVLRLMWSLGGLALLLWGLRR